MLVGTWKARSVEQKASNDLRSVAESSMLGLATQGMTVEFNRDGRFKISQFIGSGTGTYKIEGSKIKLELDTLAPNRTIMMKFGADGKTIELDREFASDASVIFDKQ